MEKEGTLARRKLMMLIRSLGVSAISSTRNERNETAVKSDGIS